MEGAPRFDHARIVLAVRDLSVSRKHYTEVLGFDLDPIDAPGWSFMSRGSVKLMLGECPDEVSAGETGNHSWFVWISVEGIDELHDDVVARGAEVVVALGDRSHGHREFVVATPDGHRIMFGERLDQIRERAGASA